MKSKIIKYSGFTCIECDGEFHWIIHYALNFIRTKKCKCNCKKST